MNYDIAAFIWDYVKLSEIYKVIFISKKQLKLANVHFFYLISFIWSGIDENKSGLD